MGRRHQRHAQGADRNRGRELVNSGAWKYRAIPPYDATAVNISFIYSGSGSGTLRLYTVTRAAPGGAQTLALTVAFAGAGTYPLAGAIPAGTYIAVINDTLGTLSLSLL